jgi:hypothetical protein
MQFWPNCIVKFTRLDRIEGCVGPRACLHDVEKWKFLIQQGFELQPFGNPARNQPLYRLRHRSSSPLQIFKYLYIVCGEVKIRYSTGIWNSSPWVVQAVASRYTDCATVAGPLSLVSTTEELLGRNSSGSGLGSREYGCGDPLCWPRGTLYAQKLALTSLTSGGRSVDTVRSRTKAMGFIVLGLSVFSCGGTHGYSLPARLQSDTNTRHVIRKTFESHWTYAWYLFSL